MSCLWIYSKKKQSNHFKNIQLYKIIFLSLRFPVKETHISMSKMVTF